MKNIKLIASSAKERLAAEQEVGARCSPCMVLVELPVFSLQASLLSKLQHPNIVAYKESFTDELGRLLLAACRLDTCCDYVVAYVSCRDAAHCHGLL